MFCLEAGRVFAESGEDVAKAAQNLGADMISLPLQNNLHFGAGPDDGKVDRDTSDYSWNVLAGLGYRVSHVITIWGVYRTMGVDYDGSSGNRRFEYDVTMTGPVVGVEFQF